MELVMTLMRIHQLMKSKDLIYSNGLRKRLKPLSKQQFIIIQTVDIYLPKETTPCLSMISEEEDTSGGNVYLLLSSV